MLIMIFISYEKSRSLEFLLSFFVFQQVLHKALEYAIMMLLFRFWLINLFYLHYTSGLFDGR